MEGGIRRIVKRDKKETNQTGGHPLKHGRVSTHLAGCSAGLGTGGETGSGRLSIRTATMTRVLHRPLQALY